MSVSGPDPAPGACMHPGDQLTYQTDPGGPWGTHTMGVETCGVCGSSRRVEGDHDGPWHPPGTAPTWDPPAPAPDREPP